MVVILSVIVSEQANLREVTMIKILQFLDYVAAHPDAIIKYWKSNLILNVHNDASYLPEPRARSRTGGHYFSSDNTKEPTDN